MKLKAPKKASVVSVGGKMFEVTKGFVTVPDELAASLEAHGYVPVDDDDQDDGGQGGGNQNQGE